MSFEEGSFSALVVSGGFSSVFLSSLLLLVLLLLAEDSLCAELGRGLMSPVGNTSSVIGVTLFLIVGKTGLVLRLSCI